MTPPRTAREQLAADLKYLREAAGLTERQLAERLGVTQSKVQRLEAGKGTTSKSLPSRHLVQLWAEATEADVVTRARLRMLVDAELRGDQSWRDRLGSRTHLQDEMRAHEAAAHTIRSFQPVIIPGLLQTPEYARYIIPLVDVEHTVDHEAALTGRLARQQALFAGEKRFEFLITEAVLRWPSTYPEMLAAQLDRVATLASLTSVEVRVLPLGEPADVVVWSPFVILESDRPFVSVEVTAVELPFVDHRQVSVYRELYDKMWERALVGQDALALIRRTATEMRSVG